MRMRPPKLLLRSGLFILVLILLAGGAHFWVFPQETRCIMIDLYSFEREDDLYYRSDVPADTVARLQQVLDQAKARVGEFWGEMTVEPKYIYCQADEDFLDFGVPFMAPACANMKLGSYVVISNQGIDLDILAHEISHTELFNRIGFFNRLRKIPTWFDEGLAMQVDDRSHFSIDSLALLTKNFDLLPDVKKLENNQDFGGGTPEEVRINYAASRYVVGKWYTPGKLTGFLEKINDGSSFEEAYDAD